ncbi:hypothetical protein [Amycolatopsis balhimycina]|uniref:hypothetical protein n=1 Tax=Amycolatopsis TaxID=1813 RepID=UPI000F7BA534|nr:hypothetical protein [Amycolatopsis balhimycina]
MLGSTRGCVVGVCCEDAVGLEAVGDTVGAADGDEFQSFVALTMAAIIPIKPITPLVIVHRSG